MTTTTEIGLADLTGNDDWLFINPIYPVASTHDARPEPHSHNFYQIYIFRQGGGEHLVAGATHTVTPLSVHIVGKHMVHCMRHTNLATGYHIGLDLEQYDQGSTLGSFHFQLLQLAALMPVLQLTHPQFDAIDNRLSLLLEEQSKTPDEFTAALIRMQFASLLAQLERYFRSQAGTLSPRQQEMAQRFRQFTQLLEQHVAQQRTVQFYADAMHMSTRALHDMVYQFTNRGVLDYISQRCYREACHLLNNTDLSIKQIAFALGFTNDSYFNRFFKKHSHIAAKAWRNRYRA